MTVDLTVLISGGGTTLANLAAEVAAGRLDARIRRVVCSKEDAAGIEKSRQTGFDTVVLPRRRFCSHDAFGEAVTAAVSESVCDLVLMAGFTHLWLIPEPWLGKVMNIHPALIPSFCGRGLHGMRVHRAVIASGVKISGCTVHFADNEYDHGPIILQRPVPVEFDDTPETLQERVFAEECIAYPLAVRRFAEGRLEIVGSRVKVRS